VLWRYAETLWRDVEVGDIVHLANDGNFPADIVLLKTSQPLGVCNIETANLDGETNLKVKQAIPETYNIECSEDGLDFPKVFKPSVIESSAPSKNLNSSSFKANITLQTGETVRSATTNCCCVAVPCATPDGPSVSSRSLAATRSWC